MKLTGQADKWASGILAVVCLVLLINVAQSSRPVRAGGNRGAAGGISNANRRESKARRADDELSRYDPEVRLDLLNHIQSRPLLKFDRNPFEFEASRVDPRPSAPVTQLPVQPPPPPPPPLPLKALGYSEKPGGVREAYISDEEQIYVVHAGESFGNRFRVIKIDSQHIEVEDDVSHQTAQLTFPQ